MLKNCKGLTLIEVISALALLSLLFILAGSLQIFGHKQVINQTADIDNQANIRYALNILTKEMRTGKIDLPITDNILSVSTDTETNVYRLEDNQLLKNDQPIVSNISEFKIDSKVVMSKRPYLELEVTVSSTPTKEGKTISLSTTIYNRSEME